MVDQRQDTCRSLPEWAQCPSQRFLQLIEIVEMLVAGHVLGLIPQPFHRVEFRAIRRQRQQMNPRGQCRIARPGVKARLIPDHHMFGLGVTVGQLVVKLTQDDSSIPLHEIRLPLGELGTRAAIAATKQKELPGQSGETFEMTLLLPQTEASNSSWHFAEVASLNERNPAQSRTLAGIGVDLHQLNGEVLALLRSQAIPDTTNTVSAPPPWWSGAIPSGVSPSIPPRPQRLERAAQQTRRQVGPRIGRRI